jgi:hypothetical protein
MMNGDWRSLVSCNSFRAKNLDWLLPVGSFYTPTSFSKRNLKCFHTKLKKPFFSFILCRIDTSLHDRDFGKQNFRFLEYRFVSHGIDTDTSISNVFHSPLGSFLSSYFVVPVISFKEVWCGVA